jgi:hypothetical protein
MSSTKLSALIRAADIASRGTSAVSVVNPPPGGGISNIQYFQITTASRVALGTGVNYASGSSYVLAQDLNGDGKLDLAIGSDTGFISVLLGNEDGTFRPQTQYPVAGAAALIASGDFNRDGKLDLAVSNYSTNGTISILLGNGDGTFQRHVDIPDGGQYVTTVMQVGSASPLDPPWR